MSTDDLSPDRLSVEELSRIHRTVVCRDRIIVGVSGDITWQSAEPLIRSFLEPWPECEEALPTPPVPDLRREGGIFVLARPLEQSTVMVAGPGGIAQEDSPDFFASRIADHLLGGSGFGSRLLATLRTNEGLAYAAYSVWTASPRYEGIVGAGTATRAEQTLEARRLLVRTLEEMGSDPPDSGEIRRAYEELANGYVFAFGSAAQIVARRMAYRAQDLSPGWLERYLEGLGEVTPDAVERVVDENLDPDEMTTLIVGDPSRFGPGLEELGTVFRLLPEGEYERWLTSPVSPGVAP
jgi:zinc protease